MRRTRSVTFVARLTTRIVLGALAAGGLGACDDEGDRPPGGSSYDAGRADAASPTIVGACVLNQIAAGARHSCAVTLGGRLVCWGQGAVPYADAAPDAGAPEPGSPREILGLPRPAAAPSAGVDATCVRFVDATIACFGNVPAAAGLAPGAPSLVPLTPWPLPGNAAAVSLGGAHATARLIDGSLAGWGTGGRVGDGTTIDRATPVVVRELAGVVSSAAGATGSCATTASGKTYCWGDNGEGRLGLPGPRGVIPAPELVPALGTDGVQVGVGDGLVCVRTGTGAVRCLAGGDFAVEVAARARVLAVGAGHACWIDEDLHVRCYGRNERGQVDGVPSAPVALAEPRGPFGASRIEVAVPDGGADAGADAGVDGGGVVDAAQPEAPPEPTFVRLSAGAEHTCAISPAGAATCWGSNEHGQLGAPAEPSSTASTRVVRVALPLGCD